MSDDARQDAAAGVSLTPRSHAGAVAEGLTAAGAAALVLVNPLAGVLAAALVPLVGARVSEVQTHRARRAARALEARRIDWERAFPADDTNAGPKSDLIAECLRAMLETDSKEKVQMLLHLLEFGVTSNARMEVLYAKRIAKTISRIDELEMMVLAALSKMHDTLAGVRLTDLIAAVGSVDANVIRSSLAVLASEGLIVSTPGQSDTFRVSDFGENVLRELAASMKEPHA